MRNRVFVPIGLTLVAALLWASSFSVVKVGLRYINPYQFAFLRFLVATVVLNLLLILRGEGGLLIESLQNKYVQLLAICLTASFLLQFVGQAGTTAAKAAIIINSSVILVAPASRLMLREVIDRLKALAMFVGLIGVVLITTSKGDLQGGSLRADLIVCCSAVSYAIYVVLTKLAVGRSQLSDRALVAGVFTWSVPLFLVSTLISGLTWDVSPRAWLTVAYLAVFCSVIPFILWTSAIRHIGALTSAIVLLAELVFGVLIAIVFLGETISQQVFVGCILIGAGILLVGKKPS